jgi:hypothetical protein
MVVSSASLHALLAHVAELRRWGWGCFGIIQLLNAGSVLLSYQPIIVLRILMIGFGGD